MCVYVCICMCVVYVCVHVCTCVYVSVYICTYVCTCVYVCTCICVNVHTCMHVYLKGLIMINIISSYYNSIHSNITFIILLQIAIHKTFEGEISFTICISCSN